MRRLTMRGVCGSVVAVAALAGATGPATATAAVWPACSTNLVNAPVGAQSYCTFDNPYDRATIAVAVDGTVTVTLRCNSQYGYTYTTTRTVSKTTAWAAYTPGGCRLELTSAYPETTAVATSTPTLGPIIEPYPVP